MKKFWIIAAALLVVLAAFACKKSENTSTETSATVSETGVSATDTSATTSTTDTSGTTGTATSSAAPLTDEEKEFVNKAAQGGLAEVSLGTMAAQKATNPDVKAFANQMVTDHGNANDKLKTIATAKGLTLPADTDDDHKKAAEKLNAESAAKFDKAYMKAMAEDHDKDVKEFEEASQKVKDPDLKTWTDTTLGVIKQHQQMAHDLVKKLK